MLVASGIQPHPGPTRFTESSPCVLNVINGGALITHLEAFIQRPAHVLAISEHSVPPDERGSVHDRLKEANLSGTLSNLDPELKHHTGGVAALARHPAKVDVLSPRSDQMVAPLSSGRVQMSALCIGYSSPLLAFIIYGWTGGRQSTQAAKRTDDIFIHIIHELSLRPEGPVAIMGDLNATLQQLPHCKQLIDDGAWCDVGAVASRWGGIDNQPTCFGHNALEPTRNDYFIVNSMASH